MLNQDFRDILSSLKRAKADFIVVGAFALASHGRPMATGDIEVFVLSKSDLFTNKKATAREKDGGDIAWLTSSDITS